MFIDDSVVWNVTIGAQVLGLLCWGDAVLGRVGLCGRAASLCTDDVGILAHLSLSGNLLRLSTSNLLNNWV